jgi:hypothetical protein
MCFSPLREYEHAVPEDGYEHDTSPNSLACPCQPELVSILWVGSAICHRHINLSVPDYVPLNWGA